MRISVSYSPPAICLEGCIAEFSFFLDDFRANHEYAAAYWTLFATQFARVLQERMLTGLSKGGEEHEQ